MPTEKLKFKPYARLLTMLGDQLIKNERVALVEIIKNSYDADATWVDLRFENFDEDFSPLHGAQIVIEDNGQGMTEEVIRNHWVNPATPGKLQRKKEKPRTTGGRIVQGEKGIGRFALLKLGRHISITTRPAGGAEEYTLGLDLTSYDENFIVKKENKEEALFLDDLNIQFDRQDPATVIVERPITIGARQITRPPYGTRIVIRVSDYPWNTAKVKEVYLDLVRLQTIFGVKPPEPVFEAAEEAVVQGATAIHPEVDQSSESPLAFDVLIHRNGQLVNFNQERQDELETLMEEASVLKFEEGQFDPETLTFKFKQNGLNKVLNLDDAEVTGLKVFRNFFVDGDKKVLQQRKLQCGPFGFSFFVFDLSATAKGRYELDKRQKELLKEHRIYLYRDDIRVYPYGDPSDDWLGIDIYRGTVRASEFLSNDQVLGFVAITQAKNPQLKDKTSREGLIDVGNATQDFINVLRVFLAWMRRVPYEDYRRLQEKKEELETFNKKEVENAFNKVIEAVKDVASEDVKTTLNKAAQLYQAERKYLVQRAETTEHLAGVGLSVETASHDLMVALSKSLTAIDRLLSEAQRPGTLDKQMVVQELTMLRGSLSFIETQLKDVQLLFRSTKQRRRDQRVSDLLDKVLRLFRPSMDRARISVTIDKSAVPLVAKTTEAVLLQVMLNLFDNAVYWLESSDEPRKIEIRLNGEEGTLTFSDNGPGIREEDVAYLFDAFFSGKGQEGRGLGLYIARQLLQRHDYDISLITNPADKILPGANFQISFVREDSK